MTWKSFIDTNRGAVHVMPCDTDPPHEMSDCWCHPSEEVVIRECGSTGVLVSHNHEWSP